MTRSHQLKEGPMQAPSDQVRLFVSDELDTGPVGMVSARDLLGAYAT